MRYRIVGCIPAGRRRYLELQVPHLLRVRHLLDEVHLWHNTIIPHDVGYMQSLAELHPDFFRIIPPERPLTNCEATCANICPFWRQATDPEAIYVRLDDDIVWMAPYALEKLIAHRLAHPEAFLVFGNIVNNSFCSYLHQRFGCIPLPPHSPGLATPDAMCPVAWKDPAFAESAHRAFLKHLADESTDRYLFTRWILPTYQRFGINVCCWFGRDFRREDPELMKGEEEHWVTRVRPRELGRPNEICGSALFAHFAYFTQRKHMDQTDVLERYRRLEPVAEVDLVTR